jgi:hypothetical protein
MDAYADADADADVRAEDKDEETVINRQILRENACNREIYRATQLAARNDSSATCSPIGYCVEDGTDNDDVEIRDADDDDDDDVELRGDWHAVHAFTHCIRDRFVNVLISALGRHRNFKRIRPILDAILSSFTVPKHEIYVANFMLDLLPVWERIIATTPPTVHTPKEQSTDAKRYDRHILALNVFVHRAVHKHQHLPQRHGYFSMLQSIADKWPSRFVAVFNHCHKMLHMYHASLIELDGDGSSDANSADNSDGSDPPLPGSSSSSDGDSPYTRAQRFKKRRTDECAPILAIVPTRIETPTLTLTQSTHVATGK